MGEPVDNPDAPIPADGIFPGTGWERHSLGRFGEGIVAYLGRGDSHGKIQGTDAYIIVESVELGNDPSREQIRVQFRFSGTPAGPDHVPRWGASASETHVEHQLEPGMGPATGMPRYSFTFTDELSYEENVGDFLEFIEFSKSLMGVPQSYRDEVLSVRGIKAVEEMFSKAGFEAPASLHDLDLDEGRKTG